jgi:predicted transcriptional regulator
MCFTLRLHTSAAPPRVGLTQALGVAQVILGCYHQSMKVAISLPDTVFSAAEKLAHRLRVSRSQLYAQAIEEYLGKRQDSLVTEQLNAVYAAEQEPIDPSLVAAQLRAIDHEAW